MAWEQSKSAPGTWLLKRRYLKAFEIEGSPEYGITAFEWSRAGWTGSTTFMADAGSDARRLRYFNKQRVGVQVWPK